MFKLIVHLWTSLGVLGLWSSSLFAGYSNVDVLDVSADVNQPVMSEVILSYKKEPICITSVHQNPDLVPSFFEMGVKSSSTKAKVDLPECNPEEINHITTLSENSVLVNDPRQGIQTVSAFVVPPTVCVLSFLGGIVVGGFEKSWTSDPFSHEGTNSTLLWSLSAALALFPAGLLMEEASKNGTQALKRVGGKLPGGALVVSCAGVGYFSVDYLVETVDTMLRGKW